MLFPNNFTLRDDVVALFPGQGSITSGAGRAWRESDSWFIVDAISSEVGVDVARLLLSTPDEELVRTDNAQLATFALSLVGFHHLIVRGCRPRYYVGHSLGEFSALVASGYLSLEDGSRLIAVRGRAMARAAASNPGSMVALMGGEDEARERLGELNGAWIANINGEGQIVVSGNVEAIDELFSRHRDLGWRRATKLPVGGAFHSPLMAPAQDELDDALAAVTWRPSDAVVMANVLGAASSDPSRWPDLLSRQLTAPVQFLDATRAIPDHVTTTVELPPGNVLSGLVKRIRTFANQVVLAEPVELPEELT